MRVALLLLIGVAFVLALRAELAQRGPGLVDARRDDALLFLDVRPPAGDPTMAITCDEPAGTMAEDAFWASDRDLVTGGVSVPNFTRCQLDLRGEGFAASYCVTPDGAVDDGPCAPPVVADPPALADRILGR